MNQVLLLLAAAFVAIIALVVVVVSLGRSIVYLQVPQHWLLFAFSLLPPSLIYIHLVQCSLLLLLVPITITTIRRRTSRVLEEKERNCSPSHRPVAHLLLITLHPPPIAPPLAVSILFYSFLFIHFLWLMLVSVLLLSVADVKCVKTPSNSSNNETMKQLPVSQLKVSWRSIPASCCLVKRPPCIINIIILHNCIYPLKCDGSKKKKKKKKIIDKLFS